MPVQFDDFYLKVLSNATDIKYQLYASDEETLQTCLRDIREKYLQDAHTVWRALLEGLKGAIEQELACRRIWNQGSGRWFVVATQWKWEDRLNLTGVGKKIEVQEYDDKAAAIEAAKALNEKYTGETDDEVKVEVDIMPEIAYKKGLYTIEEGPS